MCTMDRALKWLECPLLGVVAPPYSKPQTRNGGSCVYQSQDWYALYRELA